MSISALLSTAEDPPHPNPTAHPPQSLPPPHLPLATNPQNKHDNNTHTNHTTTITSISSSLLSSLPSSLHTTAVTTTPTSSHRSNLIEKHQPHHHRNQEHPRQQLKQHATANSRATIAQYPHPYDADATDSDNEPAYQAATKKAMASRDFKYHDAMDIDQDIEATDSTEDSDEFTNQRQTYMTKSRKRQLDLNEAETSNREVKLFRCDVNLLPLCSC